MIWIYLLIIAFIIAVFIIIIRKKEKKPNHDVSISKKEKELLDKDYLTHGSVDNQKNDNNI
ncbi:hypothetical protein CIL03_04960 [Virgibacillus indicus]|uniref:Uncharacterized protein n=1 Tax=Virgibacillus indicus TaxID=2024554 RepID=A0A265NEM1_9BACI|nr:hypothetical protein [Virgibacillus indicus]OZU90500.1 hypothetical protein CIL03_04960 [Virgibacillus indicus]